MKNYTDILNPVQNCTVFWRRIFELSISVSLNWVYRCLPTAGSTQASTALSISVSLNSTYIFCRQTPVSSFLLLLVFRPLFQCSFDLSFLPSFFRPVLYTVVMVISYFIPLDNIPLFFLETTVCNHLDRLCSFALDISLCSLFIYHCSLTVNRHRGSNKHSLHRLGHHGCNRKQPHWIIESDIPIPVYSQMYCIFK